MKEGSSEISMQDDGDLTFGAIANQTKNTFEHKISLSYQYLHKQIK